MIPSPDIALDKPDNALRIMHRRLKDADVYLLFNEGAEDSTHALTLRGNAKRVEKWDPQSGSISPLNGKPSKGAVDIQIKLKPYETEVLVMR